MAEDKPNCACGHEFSWHYGTEQLPDLTWCNRCQCQAYKAPDEGEAAAEAPKAAAPQDAPVPAPDVTPITLPKRRGGWPKGKKRA